MILLCLTFKKKNLYSTYFCRYVFSVNVCALCNKIMFLTRQCIAIKVSFSLGNLKGEILYKCISPSEDVLAIWAHWGNSAWADGGRVNLPAETVDVCTAPWHLLSKGWCLAHADCSLMDMTLCLHQTPDTSRCYRFCSVLWVQGTYAERFFACCKRNLGSFGEKQHLTLWQGFV